MVDIIYCDLTIIYLFIKDSLIRKRFYFFSCKTTAFYGYLQHCGIRLIARDRITHNL